VRFLLSRRWVLFGLGVALLALLCVRLGEWQFSRLHDREQHNEFARTNLAASPAPVQDVLAPDREVPPDREWMRVQATGRYDAAATVVLRYQSREGRAQPLRELLKTVARRYPGDVVEVQLRKRGRRLTYRIRLLDSAGRLITVNIDAASKRILSAPDL